MEIKSIKAKRILDSRGQPTVAAIVETGQGSFLASVPSGTSRGEYEAVSVDATHAVKNIEEVIAARLKGENATNQQEIDRILIELDGTENKSRLGANAILAVSIACCRAGAAAKNIALYQHISAICQYNTNNTAVVYVLSLPRPCFNILEGGAHAKNDLALQEFMVVPQVETFRENLQIGKEVYQQLSEILQKKFGKAGVNLGEERGFAPPLERTKDALDLVRQATEKIDPKEKEEGEGKGAWLTKIARAIFVSQRDKIKLGLDCAASQFFTGGKYNLEGRKRTREELTSFYQGLLKEYPILFLEDPFSQDDWQGFQILFKKGYNFSRSRKSVTGEFLVVGDDLTVTNPQRIKKAHQEKACNAIVLKPNQIGTVTETIAAAKLAKEFGWKIIVSHRSGETTDDFIADLAVGLRADFIKSGAPAGEERMAKYNRLVEIEKEHRLTNLAGARKVSQA